MLHGVPHVMRSASGHPSVDLVSLVDRTFLLTMDKSTSIQPMSWVRLIRYGKYKDDLGFVVEVDKHTTKLDVYVVPRIQLDRKRKRKTQDKRRQGRPPAALFDPDTVAEYYGAEAVQLANQVHCFKSEVYVAGGLLELEYSQSEVSDINVNPTPHELALFQSSRQEQVIKALKAGTVPLSIGNRIKVIVGTFMGLTGRVVEIKVDNTVVFETDDMIRHEVFNLEICKYFIRGDYVRVLRGEFSGKEGFIVGLDRNSVVIYERTVAVEEVRLDIN